MVFGLDFIIPLGNVIFFVSFFHFPVSPKKSFGRRQGSGSFVHSERRRQPKDGMLICMGILCAYSVWSGPRKGPRSLVRCHPASMRRRHHNAPPPPPFPHPHQTWMRLEQFPSQPFTRIDNGWSLSVWFLLAQGSRTRKSAGVVWASCPALMCKGMGH